MFNFVWSVWRGFVSMAALKRSAAAIVVASLFALGLRLVEFWAMPLFCGSRPTGGDIGLLQRSAAGVSGFAIVFFPCMRGARGHSDLAAGAVVARPRAFGGAVIPAEGPVAFCLGPSHPRAHHEIVDDVF